MPRERPVITYSSPSLDRSVTLRGKVSPCVGCKNNTPVNDGELDYTEYTVGPVCPKRLLYKLKSQYQGANKEQNWEGPIFDESLLATNPVWPGHKKHGNAYGYVFVATHEDNVDSGWNPAFDTEIIVCRGPMLIKETERSWHLTGHLERNDPVLVTLKHFFINGQEFQGFAESSQVWQNSIGYGREIDRNLGKSLSANGEL
jgi:hypothetical protein